MGVATEAVPITPPANDGLDRVDLELTLPSPITVEGTRDLHTCVVLAPKLDRDVYVAGRLVKPGNERVLHHTVSYILRPGTKEDGSSRSQAELVAEIEHTDGVKLGEHFDMRPAITVDPEPIFIHDDHIWTSAGVLAGVDLALALVEDDLGSHLALKVARYLLVFLKRPGGQAQFSTHLQPNAQPSRALQGLVAHMVQHPADDLSVEALAARVAMSPRNFARRFRCELQTTPAAYVNRVRVEAARRRLEFGDESIEQVAQACGFGTAETMRRAFLRTVQVAPAAYRARFATDTST